jgi:hypothetical protein
VENIIRGLETCVIKEFILPKVIECRKKAPAKVKEAFKVGVGLDDVG